jgi:hypothetical protein
MTFDDDKPDFFDGEDLPETEKEKKEKYLPDDPRYWLEPESRWEHLRPLLKLRLWGIIIGSVAVVVLIWWGCVRFLRPYAEGCVQYGYVDKLERRGSVFKTVEGRLIPYQSVVDTTKAYTGDFYFSVTDNNVAKAIDEMMVNHKPMKIYYKEYSAGTPWRGETKYLVVSADSVSEREIQAVNF